MWLLNVFLDLSITLKIKDFGYSFSLNKETLKLISVFNNELFDENKYHNVTTDKASFLGQRRYTFEM